MAAAHVRTSDGGSAGTSAMARQRSPGARRPMSSTRIMRLGQGVVDPRPDRRVGAGPSSSSAGAQQRDGPVQLPAVRAAAAVSSSSADLVAAGPLGGVGHRRPQGERRLEVLSCSAGAPTEQASTAASREALNARGRSLLSRAWCARSAAVPAPGVAAR